MLGLADIASLLRTEWEGISRQNAQAAYLGEDRVLARVLGRYKMFLHTSDIGFSCHVMLDGYWESWLTQFFARTVKPGMRVVDVGANYGYYTLLFADAVTPSGRVLAVEPNPAVASLLRDSVYINGFRGHTTVMGVALGDSPEGTGYLVVPDREPKNAQVRRTPVDDRSQSVPVTTLDRVACEFGPIDLVKIDAEGAEVDIIAGMKDLLAGRPPALLLEFCASRCADPAGFLAYLSRIYGGLTELQFDGELHPTTAEALLSGRLMDDRLLYFASPAA